MSDNMDEPCKSCDDQLAFEAERAECINSIDEFLASRRVVFSRAIDKAYKIMSKMSECADPEELHEVVLELNNHLDKLKEEIN